MIVERNHHPAGRGWNMLFGLAQIADGLVRVGSLGFLHTRLSLIVARRQALFMLDHIKRKDLNPMSAVRPRAVVCLVCRKSGVEGKRSFDGCSRVECPQRKARPQDPAASTRYNPCPGGYVTRPTDRKE